MSFEKIMRDFYRQQVEKAPLIRAPQFKAVEPIRILTWDDLLGLAIVLLCLIHYFSSQQWLAAGRFFSLLSVPM